LFDRLPDEPQLFSSYGLEDPQGIVYTNRRFIFTRLTMDVSVYVFGPDGTYSRRVYGRGSDGRYTIVRDEETTGGTVDNLR